MMGDEGKKRGKKKVFVLLLAAIGAVTALLKKRKAGAESGWEEARPEA